MPGNVAIGKAVINYDESGKLTGASSYDLQGVSPNIVQSSSAFTYNGKGQVIKVVLKNKDGELVRQNNYSYYDDGHVKEGTEWKENDGELWMSHKTSYSLPNGYYPSGMEQLHVLLGADFIARMYSETIAYLTYSQAGVITNSQNAQMSARDYNEDGTLQKQVVTSKYIKPEKDDKVSLYEYKYIKQ